MARDPVIHHVVMCVLNADDTFDRLRKFGFKLFAKRQTALCRELVVRIGQVNFIITERKDGASPYITNSDGSKVRSESFSTFCCEKKHDEKHVIDSVFNVAFEVRNIELVLNRIKSGGGCVIQPITTLKDKYGEIQYCIIESVCGNVLHTLLQKNSYHGPFISGYELVECFEEDLHTEKYGINFIDHVTLACYSGHSERILRFYEMCFGMKKFSIGSKDDLNDGLILEEGVGLRLRAMEYYKCAETGLVYSNTGGKAKERDPHTMMLVVVESLEGQTNCNVETFLREHGQPGVEHIALNSRCIVNTVEILSKNGVNFRKPPILYYEELQKGKEISNLGKNILTLARYGILLDLEDSIGDGKNNFLMQIFARSLFDRQTFFIEVIERNGAKFLGAGNILALVRSIREEERRKAVDAETNKLLQAREASVANNIRAT